MVTIGVFGGRRGDTMIAWCAVTGKAQVIAVCERDPTVVAGLKEKYPSLPIAYETDFEALLSHKPDAIVIANYATEHAPYAIRALESGISVLSEVMPFQTLAEAVQLVEAVEKSGKTYAYAENYCYMPAPREMRKLYRAGKLGKFEYGEGEYIHNCEPIWPNITYGERDHWRNRMYATFYCTHSLGPLLHITGLRPVSVTGFELPYTDRCSRMGLRAGVGGLEMVTLENGAVVRSLHGFLAKDSIRYCIYGSRGRLESIQEDAKRGGVQKLFVNLDKEEGVYLDNPKLTTPKLDKVAQGYAHGSSDFYVMNNFVEALQGKKADIIDVYEATDMFLPGLFGWFSVLEGGTPQKIPNFREAAERAPYRQDTRCCDPAVAGDMLLPSYSKGEIEVPDEIYAIIRRRFENINK